MVSRDDSGRSAASSKEQSRKDVELSRGSNKITMFFQKKQEKDSLPLAPRNQRAIPKVRQAAPRPILHSSSQDDPDTKPLKQAGNLSTTEQGTTEDRNSAEMPAATKSAMTRDDAVDVKVQAVAKEMHDDVVTNPVVQANKRALRSEKDVTFLASHTSKSKTVSFQDEQIALLEEQGARGEANAADFEHEIEIEQASDDDEDAPKTRSRLRKNRQVDDDYDEKQAEKVAQEDSGSDAVMDDLEAETILDDLPKKPKGDKPEKKHSRRHRTEVEEAQLGGEEQEETVFIDNLPNEEQGIRSMLIQVRRAIVEMEKAFLLEEDSDPEEDARQLTAMKVKHNPGAGFDSDGEQDLAPVAKEERQYHCIPLSVNVLEYDFEKLGQAQLNHGGRLFDIITMDPPWQLSSANPTRGVAIAYDTLVDDKIMDLPFHLLQTDGFLFIWVINAKYRFALNLFQKHKYKLVDEIVWVKQTINGKINKGHGYYLQHAKETCLIGYKGDLGDRHKINVDSDVIFSMRRGQSQKPEEIYEIAESLVPNGYFLEIFGRRNNLHDGWVTMGNEL